MSGLRNPYRFSFDAASGDLLIGDVGGALVGHAEHQLGQRDALGARREELCVVERRDGPGDVEHELCLGPEAAHQPRRRLDAGEVLAGRSAEERHVAGGGGCRPGCRRRGSGWW